MTNLRRLGVLAVASVLLVSLLSCRSARWKAVKAETRRRFPGVTQISTAELSAWLNDEKRQKPILLDVRTEAEFAVSHLAGAIRMEPGSNIDSLRFPEDGPIVTYCSVGYRSSLLADKMQQAGYKNVRNLEGSIFQWANENRPLVNDVGATEKVHPFDAVWGNLVDKAHRADLPTTP